MPDRHTSGSPSDPGDPLDPATPGDEEGPTGQAGSTEPPGPTESAGPVEGASPTDGPPRTRASRPGDRGSTGASAPDDASAGDPGDPRETAYGLLQRGHDLMRARHHAQAATVLARAARLEPRKGSILEALGRAYYNSGQHDHAADTFEALLEVDPSAHYAHYALGQSLKQLGRPKEARTHLRLAVALSPSSRLYEAALNRLGSIERD